MTRRIVLIEGDGIGPEVSEATLRIIASAGVDLDWVKCPMGRAAYEKFGTYLPDETIDAIRRHRIALKGRILTPEGRSHRSPTVALRRILDLYVNLRPVRTRPGIPSRYDDVDLVIVRENTEGPYAGLEHLVTKGVVESIKIVTEKGSERIARFAFSHAQREGRRKVTAVHKANIQKMSDGLFIRTARRVAEEYPDIEYDELIVDAACMRLVMDPSFFDLILLDNLYGDIVSDLAAGLAGGISAVGAANLGGDFAVFEAIHGDAPRLVGKNLANPLPMLNSAIMLLRHVGEGAAAARIFNAVTAALGETRTRDMGGTATTKEFTEAVIRSL